MEKLEEQANQSVTALQKISATGTKFQEVGGKLEGVGKAILPVSAAITGIGVAGIKVASDFEKSMSGVKAITGATTEDFEKLRETAVNLGASTSFSSGEVAQAMTEMAKTGWSTTQIIDGMSGVLDATAASGENLGSAATIVADAITGFGLSAKDSATVADLMTQAANSGTFGIGDLGESYKYIAPMAQSMGLSIQDVTTALSAMSMAGIKDSLSGREGMSGLVEKISAAVDAFTNMNPAVQKAVLVVGGIVAVAGLLLIIAAIAALVAAFIYLWNTNEDFRQFWIDLWENIKEVAIAVWNAISTFITTTVTAIQTFITTAWNTIRTVITTVLNAIKTVFTTIWDAIKSVITTVVNGIKSCIGAVEDAVSSVADKIKSFLHFSVPDEGPLTDYENWMPDFMSGLARGIEKSKGMVASAMDGVAVPCLMRW